MIRWLIFQRGYYVGQDAIFPKIFSRAKAAFDFATGTWIPILSQTFGKNEKSSNKIMI